MTLPPYKQLVLAALSDSLASMAEPHALFAHILAQTRQNVQLLIAHGQIPEKDGEEILSRLAVTATRLSDESSVASLTQKTQRLSMSPAPPKVEARAIWEWSSEVRLPFCVRCALLTEEMQDPNDLSFEAGEIVEVVTETNADWWMGRNRSGKQGLFPSNYVEKLPPPNLSPILVPEPRKSMIFAHSNGPVEQRYSSPALPYPPPRVTSQPYTQPYSGYNPPAGPPPGAANYSYAPPPGPPTPQPVTQQAPAKKGKFGGLGQVVSDVRTY